MIAPLLAALVLVAAAPSDGADQLPYKKVAVEKAGVELPVPVDWVRLPSEDAGGVEAQFISVQDMGELDVFSVPFECHFNDGNLDGRAREVHDFVTSAPAWQDLETRLVTTGSATGMVLRATWSRMDEPADVLALALPTSGRTVLVMLMMAVRPESRFEMISSLLEKHTLVLAPPSAPAPPAGRSSYDDGRGFELHVPAGWRRVTDVELGILGDEAGADGERSGAMVGFVRPAILRQSPNFILDLTPSLVPVSVETLPEFESRYRELIGPRTSPFTLDRASIESIAGRPSFRMEGRMEAAGLTLRQLQYFVPMEQHSLVVTFSLPEHLVDRLLVDVESVLGSLVLSEPGGEEATTGTPANRTDDRAWHLAIGGLAALLALVIVVFWVRKRR